MALFSNTDTFTILIKYLCNSYNVAGDEFTVNCLNFVLNSPRYVNKYFK